MQRYRHRLLSTTYLTLALGSGVLLLAPAVVGGAGADLGGLAYAACNPCNPCAAAANPCNPCNPCAAIKIANPCNPRRRQPLRRGQPLRRREPLQPLQSLRREVQLIGKGRGKIPPFLSRGGAPSRSPSTSSM